MHPHLHTVILYHAKCQDGFGAAYAAWKKYGDNAEYIPVKHGGDVPGHMDGREIILVDFCFPKDKMETLRSVAESVTVLDHHEGVREVATSFPGVFDTHRSGATIAWAYFHPEAPVPELLTHLEDADLYRYALPDTRPLNSYLSIVPFAFDRWDEVVQALQRENARATILAKGTDYTEYMEALAELSVHSAKKVRFEGYEILFANTHQTMKSYVGHKLYELCPPFALVVSAHPDGFGVSIRGDKSVDVAEIAKKYGGNGHPGSAGFFIPAGGPLPWTEIEED